VVRKRKRTLFLFVLPAVCVIGFVALFPGIYSLWLALNTWRLGTPLEDMRFTGLSNFVRVVRDTAFWDSMKVSFGITASCIASEVLVGFLVALLLHKRVRRGFGILRPVLLIPAMLAPVVAGMVWKLLLNPLFGWINYYLGIIGVDAPPWLTRPDTAFIAVVAVDFWQWMPFCFLLLYAGLQSLPKEPFEAAAIDGAGPLRSLWYITLPLLRPVLGATVLIRFIDCVKYFDTIYVLTFGGPGRATEVVPFYTYKQAFAFSKMGLGAAQGWIFTAVVLLGVLALIRVFRVRFWEEGKA